MLREMWSKGDEIIVSAQDNESNAGFWRRLGKTGITVREWGVDPDTGMLEPSELDMSDAYPQRMRPKFHAQSQRLKVCVYFRR